MNKKMEYRLNKDKTINKNYVDVLNEDKPIAGQKYVCLSFVSPEDILKDKHLFYFEKFLKHFDFKKSLDKYTQFLNFLSYKYNLDFQKLSKDLGIPIIETIATKAKGLDELKQRILDSVNSSSEEREDQDLIRAGTSSPAIQDMLNPYHVFFTQTEETG